MSWIATTCGAVNASYVVRVERDSDGSMILHLTNGKSVKSPMLFDVVDGELTMIDPADDDDSIPF